MKRRVFLGRVTGGAAAGASVVAVGEEASSVPLVRTPAVVMAPRPDGVEVVWAVSRLARGRVEWKSDDGSTGVAAADAFGMVPQGEEILRVRLDGLTAGRQYQVRTVTEAAEGDHREDGPWKSFRTLDAAAAETRFVVWNDTHENKATLERLHAVSPACDFLIWNGDTTNDWHQRDWLIPTLLHPAGLDISEGRPLMLVWGNHDVRGAWAFQVPEMVATPHGRPFYAFRSGPVAAVCLHTGEDKPDSHPSFRGRAAFEDLRREQAAWLQSIIAQPAFRDAPYRIVFCHIPLRWLREPAEVDYANGGYDAFSRFSREAWHDALVSWKAQLVVSGHTHHPASIPPNDTFPYGQLTGGGPQPERATWIDARATAAALTLEMKSLDGRIVESVTLHPIG